MKTLAELKRNANTGKMKLELIERYGNTEIPERIKGIRTVKKANTVALIIQNENGEISELRFDSAKLVDYDGDTLIIYEAGERKPNEEEKEVLKKIEDIYKDSNSGYWQVRRYEQNCSCPWMAGNKTIKGKRYQRHNGMVKDNSIKGKAILKYNVYMED